MAIYFRLLSFAKNLRGFLLPFILTSLIASIFGVLNLVMLKPLLDVLFGKVADADLLALAQKPQKFDALAYYQYWFANYVLAKGKLGGLQFVCISIVVSVLTSNIFKYLSVRLLESFKVGMVANLREAVFRKTLDFELGFFSNERKGNLISRVTTDVQEVENSIANSFSAAVTEFFLFIGYVVALFAISVKLTLFALLVIPLTGTFLASVQRRMRQDAGESQTRLSNLISLMDEAFGGMRVVKAFVAERFIGERFAAENQGYKRAVFSYAKRRELASPFSEVIGVSMVASLLFYGGSLILTNGDTLEASMFISYIAIFSQVVRPAKTISQAFSTSQRGIAAGQRILQLIESEPTVQDAPDAQAAPPFAEAITFEGVHFAYPDGPEVLKEINLTIPKGKTVALVGSSGGGKSTLADLIPRFYDPTQGRVLLDGRDLRTLQQASLRSQMGIVTQEAVLFNDTIFNNIAFGENASQEEVEAAARIANAHEFITRQPEGYQTIIGDRGTKLSGGQRQRLSIARAILQNPPILLLDEATSALDTESERLVQDALTKLMQNRTTLVIAHRLSTIQNADEIVVIHQGQIAERGSHEELLRLSDGIYRKLVALQGATAYTS